MCYGQQYIPFGYVAGVQREREDKQNRIPCFADTEDSGDVTSSHPFERLRRGTGTSCLSNRINVCCVIEQLKLGPQFCLCDY